MIAPLAPGERVTFTAVTRFVAAGKGNVTATLSGVPQDPASVNTATVVLTVLQPVVRLLSTVASPNGVTVASGTDFPPGIEVVLTWDVGIMQRMSPITVNGKGRIDPVQVVIFRRDQLGVRNLIVTGKDSGWFTPVRTELLIAPRSVSPPNFVERN